MTSLKKRIEHFFFPCSVRLDRVMKIHQDMVEAPIGSDRVKEILELMRTKDSPKKNHQRHARA